MRRRVLSLAVVISALIPATALAATASGTFRGKTSQGKRLVIRVSHGRFARGSAIPFSLHCENGALSGRHFPTGKLRRGRLSRHVKINSSAGSGIVVHGRGVERFVVRGKVMTGSYSERDTVVRSSNHAVLDHCSVALTFRATR